MNLLYVTFTLNFLLMLVMPFVLGAFLARRLGTRWGLFWAGAATFIASQLVRLPLNALLLLPLVQRAVRPAGPSRWELPVNAVVLGLSAGVCEELARYLVLRFLLKRDHTWRKALMFGAGHGGIEAVILGGLAAVTTLNIFILRNVDPAQLGVPAAQLPALQQQMAALWSLPWYYPLLGALERVLTVCTHLGLTVLVLQVFTRRNPLWLLAAIAWHALADGAAVLALPAWGPYWTELMLVGVAFVSLAFVFGLRQPEPAAPLPVPVGAGPLAVPPDPAAAAPSAEQLERTRYQ